MTGSWQTLAFEEAPGLGSIFALRQRQEIGLLQELCQIDPEACVMTLDGRRAVDNGTGISALATDGRALWFVLRDVIVRHEEGAPMFVRLLPERIVSDRHADTAALAALRSRPAIGEASWGPRLPACFHTRGEADALCVDASEFTVGHGKGALRGAVVPLRDTAGAWTAELTRTRGGRVRIWIEGERALVVDVANKPAVGVALERYDAETEAALLRDRQDWAREDDHSF